MKTAVIKTMMLGFVSSLIFAGCAPSAPQLKKVMEENPDILYAAIQKDPRKFLEVVNEAAQRARAEEERRFAEEEAKAREEEFKNPKQPEIAEDRAFEGAKDAPITIVEYSDFQCPFCRRGHDTMKRILKEYDGKVKIVFKNFPIERIHPLALPASKMYEAIALQDMAKAAKFKSMIFENQEELNAKGEKFITDAAKKVGADLARAKKDMESEKVLARIEADKAEADKFGFSGTPGYLINGVSLKGAYPFDEFKSIIDQHLASK